MQLIDETNAASYLLHSGYLDKLPDFFQAPAHSKISPIKVSELAGGISNIVLLVEFPDSQRKPFVLKQARPQLRVADPWFCSVERAWREVLVLQVCEQLLTEFQHSHAPKDDSVVSASSFRFSLPRVLFEDKENFLFATEAAPPHQVWKTLLLQGNCNRGVAVACGQLLGILHAASWNNERVSSQLADRGFFYELRVDPYYRHIARVHPKLADCMNELCRTLDENRVALVHGDFSPKNLLVYDDHLMLVDCEVGHYGDPAFDLGFFLAHLFLKAIRARPDQAAMLELIREFWSSYRQPLQERLSDAEITQLEYRAVQNFLGCTLARIDGKSKVDYLSELQRSTVRSFCCQQLLSVQSWSDIWDQMTPLWKAA